MSDTDYEDHQDREETFPEDDEPTPPPTHKHCSKCNTVQEMAAFRRYLTTAEAKAHGYSGERRVQIETKHCKDCRPRRRRNPETFTTAELKDKLKRGEIQAPLVQALEKIRTARARTRMRAAVVARWDKVKMAQYQELLAQLRDEILTVTQQRKHARNRMKDASAALALGAYCDTYLDILRRLRADLTIAGRRVAFKVEHEMWQGYLTHEEKTAIAQAWGQIEPNKAATLRPPGAFQRERGEKPLIPIIHTPIQQPITPTKEDTHEDTDNTRPATNWDDL